MNKILWISTCCVHDLASETALQVRNMIASLVERNASVVCLSSTIRSSKDPNTLHPVARELVQHSSSKFQFADQDVQYIYTITEPHPLFEMTTYEQCQFYNEMTPIMCGFKPDVVVLSSSDIVSMSCLNLARHLNIPTVFVLLEPPASEFAFSDINLIVSSSQALIDEYVTPLGKQAVCVGPFVCPDGPLMDTCRSVNLKELILSAAPDAELDLPFPDTSKRKLILLVAPNYEHGLGIFLSLYKACANERGFKKYEFAVLETEENQLLLFAGGCHYKGQFKKAFTNEEIRALKAFKADCDINEILAQTRVLLMPTLSYVSNSSLGLQAISHGVSIITTEQGTLKEQLQEAATYIEVEQELIDDMTLAPSRVQMEPWIKALKHELAKGKDQRCFWQALVNSDYVKSSKRLAYAIRPLLQLRAGNNPPLLRSGAFSLRAIISADEEVQQRAAQLAAMPHAAPSAVDKPNPSGVLSSYSTLAQERQQRLSTQGPNSLTKASSKASAAKD